MRLVEDSERPEDHFTEGELDLEPPEELALGERDDDNLLEEDLDSDGVAEEDVDEVVLELTLDDLVHSADGQDDEDIGSLDGASASQLRMAPQGTQFVTVDGNGLRPEESDDLDEMDDLEVTELEDLEESLDRILAERLAGDAEAAVEPDEPEPEGDSLTGPLIALHMPSTDGPEVAPCHEDEFVCRSCFLVRKRAQLADASGSICRDCAS